MDKQKGCLHCTMVSALLLDNGCQKASFVPPESKSASVSLVITDHGNFTLSDKPCVCPLELYSANAEQFLPLADPIYAFLVGGY